MMSHHQSTGFSVALHQYFGYSCLLAVVAKLISMYIPSMLHFAGGLVKVAGALIFGAAHALQDHVSDWMMPSSYVMILVGCVILLEMVLCIVLLGLKRFWHQRTAKRAYVLVSETTTDEML